VYNVGRPRALPWAGIICPFRALKKKGIRQKRLYPVYLKEMVAGYLSRRRHLRRRKPAIFDRNNRKSEVGE